MNKTDKLKLEFETWVINNLNIIMDACGMGIITIMLNYNEKNDNSGIVDGNTMFSVVYEKSYKRLAIRYYPDTLELFKKGSMFNLMMGLTHEVAHIFTYPLFDMAEQRYVTERQVNEINEEATEGIANIIRKLIQTQNPEILKKGRIEDKKAIRK